MRLHSTKSKEIILSNRHYPQTEDRGLFKPHGLWYSLGFEWFEWCDGENFGGIHENTFELDIDLSNVLVIKTNDDLIELFNNFKAQVYSNYWAVDWRKVASEFSGCEIQNYHHLKWNNSLPMQSSTWFCGWDVSSGCLWDLTKIKSYKKYKTDDIYTQTNDAND